MCCLCEIVVAQDRGHNSDHVKYVQVVGIKSLLSHSNNVEINDN